MDKTKKTLGILGGMGPMATVHFYRLLTSHTLAARDSDHLNIVITSTSEIPDRTDFITGKSDRDPSPVMCRDAKTLENAGAEVIAIPCNTAQFFHDTIADCVSVPVLNIVEETADHVKKRGFRCAGILATVGTIQIGAYHRALASRGIGCVTPPDDVQALVTSVIYDYVKAGRTGGEELFRVIADRMFALGCDCLILGCTELPLASISDPRIIDSLEVLAYTSITMCGCVPTGFSDEFISAYKDFSLEKV